MTGAAPVARRGPDLRRRVAARPLRQLRQAAAHAVRAAVRAAGRAGRLADGGGHRPDRGAGRARLLRRALGGDGLQPHRRPCGSTPAIREPRKRELPRGALTLAQAWASVAVAAALFMLAAGSLNPLCLLLSPRRARLGAGLQPGQALHLVAASLARPEPGHRAGRRVSRGDRPVERPGVAAARGRRRGRDLGGRASTSSTPCPTRASIGARVCGARSSVWASGARSCSPSCCTA